MAATGEGCALPDKCHCWTEVGGHWGTTAAEVETALFLPQTRRGGRRHDEETDRVTTSARRSSAGGDWCISTRSASDAHVAPSGGRLVAYPVVSPG